MKPCSPRSQDGYLGVRADGSLYGETAGDLLVVDFKRRRRL